MISNKDSKRMAIIILVLWTLAAISDTFSKTNQNIFILLIPILLIVVSLYSFSAVVLRLLLGSSVNKKDIDKAKQVKQANTLSNKLFSAIILVAIASSAYLSIALNLHIHNHVYNGWGSSIDLFVIGLIVGLSAAQGDIYWFARKKAIKLDERQMQQRYEVVDTSYKVGAWIVLASIIILSHLNSLAITPNTMFVPYLDLALTVFALPLVVASYKKT